MTTRQTVLSLLALLLLLAACAGAPPAPESPREALAQTQIALDETIQAAMNLQSMGVTTPAQEERLADLFDNAAASLRTATTLMTAGDPEAGMTSVSLAKQSLLAARGILQEAER